MIGLAACAWGLALTLMESPADAPQPLRDRDEAAAHARRAEALVGEGRLDDAERELHTAFALDASPYHLFGLAMVAKLRGDCERAVNFFVRTIDALPTSELDDDAQANTRASAERQIAECGAEVPRAPPAGSPSNTAVPPSTPVPAPVVEPRGAPDVAPPRPWARDRAGAAMLGVGLAGFVIGSGIAVAGAVLLRNATDAASASAFVATRERARRFEIAGSVAASVGAAMVIAAVVRHAVVRRKRGRQPQSATP